MNAAIVNSKVSGSIVSAFDNEELFTPWVDPKSGVKSHILTARVALLQQSFYFLNPSLTKDGRYYWFYCAFPPSGARTLAVADFALGKIHHFPDTQFAEAAPCVDERNGRIYWSNDKGIWSRTPHPASEAQLVNRFDPAFQGNRPVRRYATHHTFSSDRSALNVDAEVGNDLYLGQAPLNGEPIVVWQKLPPGGYGYNHAQFHPTDNDLQLLAQDHDTDRATWKVRFLENRLWTIRRGGELRPVYAEKPAGDYHGIMHSGHLLIAESRPIEDCRGMHGHEWWGRDGRHIWYIHYGKGVERLALGATTPELVWPHDTLSHAHSDFDERSLVADVIPPDDPANRRVLFRNLATERTVEIVSHFPDVTGLFSRYHVHPHPQFCLHDQLICYTTTVLGKIDVAFARVNDLMQATEL
jgi:hypothetical protein